MPLLSLIARYLRRKQNPLELLQSIRPESKGYRSLIHVGAHAGQEMPFYESCGFRDVVWIEASPAMFAQLTRNIESHTQTQRHLADPPRHRAICALVTDHEGDEVEFFEYSNEGRSSSIFQFEETGHRRWPELRETGKVDRLKTRTLDAIAAQCGLLETLDVLTVDVQGAELLVLKGAPRLLAHVKALVCEVSTQPYYRGGVLFPQLRDFLATHGFHPVTAPRKHGDMLFLRRQAMENVA
jgi:FkbM family methyltransferase